VTLLQYTGITKKSIVVLLMSLLKCLAHLFIFW